ncbi:hypothetical protein DTO164E3_2897 [Paecilomyces variotii]|uniref:Uncharacterized protein n=1 Tax=Byssochlamys spectabilis TaxID=264951 RepID=A0A443HMT6_BYSSP|nr:hypothetical protein C8Q69DRAFT_509094 [Paecilomyces variotii]KAJ9200578.1 hypothetical protein DTO032I3_4460 [Paecilomyces variotii]KAJ9202924.1 hypothetical protein DTO164E3_2897 [Paecilomyces variotii]KAJ9241440.1 hypothetical protein DTO169E5_3640 [Paecilomyces variotii]KAJ9278706.1 hypothetical protein DTO021D3_4329 [Paecilomyces variotii]KAJ9289611.1 hypothetical protein DTO021C3_2682 [Paecilomyces variotii]
MPIHLARPALSSLSLRALSSSSRAAAGRSSLPHHHQQQQQLVRLHQRLNTTTTPYSTSSSPPPQNRRSEFKVVPFIVLLAVGTGAYILLVKSRTAKPAVKSE